MAFFHLNNLTGMDKNNNPYTKDLTYKLNGNFKYYSNSQSSDKKEFYSRDQLLKHRITHKTKIKKTEPVVSILGCSFAVNGDISIIGGLPKAGKTTIAVEMIGTAFLDDESVKAVSTLGIRTTPANGKPVFFIDTEQSTASTDKIRKAVCTFLGTDEEPDNLFIINLREVYKAEEKLKYVLSYMHEFPDAHLWMIDGLADLLKDPNNTEDSFELVAKFMSISQKLYAPIILYLHENPNGPSKFRGNLGSEAERKCYGAIVVKKDKARQVHIIEPKFLRDSKDFEPIYCQYNQSLGRLTSLNEDEVEVYKKESDPKVKKIEQLKKLAHQSLLGGSERIRHTELSNRISNHSKLITGKHIEVSTAKKKVTMMVEMGIIEKDEEGNYRLVS